MSKQKHFEILLFSILIKYITEGEERTSPSGLGVEAQGKGAPGYRREVRVRVPAAPLQMRSCKDVQPVNHKIPQRRDSVDIEKIIKVALELLAEQEGVKIDYTLTRKDKQEEPAEAQEATA